MYLTSDELEVDEQAPFAKLVRENLSPVEQAQAFGVAAEQLSDDLSAVPKFLENIGATPDERATCLGNVAASRIGNLSVNRKITRDDIVAVREWIATQMPETVDRSTGQALGNAARLHVKMSFSEASDLAVEFAASSGNDDVLAAFLQSEAALSNKVQARALAGKISDETRRAEVLKGLE